MILRALTFWLFTASLSFAQGLPALPRDDVPQFVAIGRVNQAGFKSLGLCSGTLIAPALVLTAAHCLPNLPRGTNRVFVAGYDRGDYLAARPFTRYERHPAWQRDKGAAYDLGLIYLDEPITEVAEFAVGKRSPVDIAGQSLALVGYHGRLPHVLSGAMDCPATAHGPTLKIGCEVIPGNSGGPVLRKTDAGWEVVGVVSARQGGLAWAAGLDDWVLAAVKRAKDE